MAKRRNDLRRKETRDGASPKHYQHLDSLRGIAALIVVFSHLTEIGVYQRLSWWQWMWWYAGHQAVILFFVLSGFVLSIPYHEGRSLPYYLFATRRFIRIWVPYVVVVILTFFWRSWSNENSVPAMPLDPTWQTPLSWHLLFSHFILIGNIDREALVPPAWTLVYEMRISLLFPAIFWMFSKLPWKLGLPIAVLISLAANLAYTFLCGYSWVIEYELFETIHYVAMFVVGILLARHRNTLIALVKSFSINKIAGLYLLSLVLFFYGFYNPWSQSQRMLGDLPTMFGSAGLIILALSSQRGFFGHRVPIFIGSISYSLYLVHLPIMIAVANSFFGKIPMIVLDVIILTAVLVGAIVFWKLVERPALAWSRAIGRLRR